MRLSRLLAAFALTALAAPTLGDAQTEVTPIESLARAERAFAALSEAVGMKQAFLANLCDDAILFRPGPVNGPDVWRARPDPNGTLRWAPAFAEVAADGDLGYTNGPWEFIPAAAGGTATAFGHFVSVWKRGPEGAWCVAADIGISHERAAPGVDGVEFRSGPVHEAPRPRSARSGLTGFGVGLFRGGSGLGIGVGTGRPEDEQRTMAHEVHTMMSAERALAFDARRMGIARAYTLRATEDVRFLREGSPPTVGMTPAIAVLEKRAGDIEWRPFGRGLSSSHDLGYSYGLVEVRARGSARPDTSAYLHVWRKDREGRWLLALDIENEFPKR